MFIETALEKTAVAVAARRQLQQQTFFRRLQDYKTFRS
jgi:hypothetical protein